MADFNIIAETVPADTCVETIQDIVDLVQDYTHVNFNESFALFNFGADTPPVDQQDRPWIKLNADGTLAGVYVYVGGSWQTETGFTKGDIIMTTGTAASVTDPWRPCTSGIGTVHGVAVPDLSDRFIVGSENTYAIGDTGGESLHTLTTAEMPAHTHSFPFTQDAAGGGAGGYLNYYTLNQTQTTSSAGGGGAHENKPPYYALLFKIYVGFS